MADSIKIVGKNKAGGIIIERNGVKETVPPSYFKKAPSPTFRTSSGSSYTSRYYKKIEDVNKGGVVIEDDRGNRQTIPKTYYEELVSQGKILGQGEKIITPSSSAGYTPRDVNYAIKEAMAEDISKSATRRAVIDQSGLVQIQNISGPTTTGRPSGYQPISTESGLIQQSTITETDLGPISSIPTARTTSTTQPDTNVFFQKSQKKENNIPEGEFTIIEQPKTPVEYFERYQAYEGKRYDSELDVLAEIGGSIAYSTITFPSRTAGFITSLPEVPNIIAEKGVWNFGYDILSDLGNQVKTPGGLAGLTTDVAISYGIGLGIKKSWKYIPKIKYGSVGLYENINSKLSNFDDLIETRQIKVKRVFSVSDDVSVFQGITYSPNRPLPEFQWSGFYLEQNRKAFGLIGKTNYGYGFGTPKISLIRTPKLPITPIETSISMKSFSTIYTPEQLSILNSRFKLANIIYEEISPVSKSLYDIKVESLPDVNIKTKGGLMESVSTRNIVYDFVYQEDASLYGSSVTKAQIGDEFISRQVGDLDIQLKTTNTLTTQKKANILAQRLKEVMGEKRVRIAKGTTLIETKTGGDWHHAVDIHDRTTPLGSDLRIGYGFTEKSDVLIGDYKVMQLGEQASRKFSSIGTPRDYGFGPESHRLKDIQDFASISRYSISKGRKSWFSITKTASKSTKEALFSEAFPDLKLSGTSSTRTTLIKSGSASLSSSNIISGVSNSIAITPKSPSVSGSVSRNIGSYGSRSVSLSRSLSPSISISSPSSSVSRSVSRSVSPSPSPSRSPSRSRSRSPYLSISPSRSVSRSVSRSISRSPSRSLSRSVSISPSRSRISRSPSSIISPRLSTDRSLKPRISRPRIFAPQPKKYTPSLTAVTLGIRTKKKPKRLTGIEIRPIF